MKTKAFIYILFSAAILIGCSTPNTPDAIVQIQDCAPIPSPRACAAACSLNGEGYIFGGRTQDKKPTKDIWRYTPSTDSWTRITSFPGKARLNAVIIAYENALYMGLGFSGERVYVDSCYLRDWWRYTPDDGKWTALAQAPTTNTIRGVPYICKDRIYLYYSTGWSHTNEIACYDISRNTWEVVPSRSWRSAPLFAAAGAQCQGRYFFGTGLNWKNSNRWYEINPEDDSWKALASLPGKGRELCAYTANDTYIYLFGGRFFAGEHTGGEVFGDYLRYDAENNRWDWCGAMPCGKGENMIAFTIDNTIYFGLGEDEKGNLYNSLYSIEK